MICQAHRADIPSRSDSILSRIRATTLKLPLASSFSLCETYTLLSHTGVITGIYCRGAHCAPIGHDEMCGYVL